LARAGAEAEAGGVDDGATSDVSAPAGGGFGATRAVGEVSRTPIAGGALSVVDGWLRIPMSAAGTPITTSSIAENAIASCGRCVLAHERRGSSLAGGAASSSPSNLRSAESIAASRRAGRGGGGVGSQPDWSFSAAIYRIPSIASE